VIGISRDELARLLTTVNQKRGQAAGLSEDEQAELLRTRTILESALSEGAEGDATFSYKADW
jgi:hypothetical protein